MGSGKIWGKGFLEGTQNQFNFVPEHWTDFPYSVWAEEWGFVGSVFLLSIFSFLLIWILERCTVGARSRGRGDLQRRRRGDDLLAHPGECRDGARHRAGRRRTLPFISYGGASLVTFFLAMGLVANVSLRKHG